MAINEDISLLLDQAGQMHWDLIVVGAGIAGSIICDQLRNKKIRILLIESGSLKIDSKLQDLNKMSYSGLPHRENFYSRLRQYGGACNVWAGRLMTMQPEDFSERAWIDSSGWPITYQQIKYWYKELDSLYGFPSSDALIENNYREKSQDNLYRNFANDDLFKIVKAVWAKKTPRFGAGSKTFKALLESKNVEVLINTTLINLKILDDNSIACKVVGKNGLTSTIKARKVVLASGGIENARILLSSQSAEGHEVGNKNGNVGRYYMDHPTNVSGGIDLKVPIGFTSLVSRTFWRYRLKSCVSFSAAFQAKMGYTNNYVEVSLKFPDLVEKQLTYLVDFVRTKKYKSNLIGGREKEALISAIDLIYLINPSHKIPHSLIFLYENIKRAINSKYLANQIVISHHLEQKPNWHSRITLGNKMLSEHIPIVDLNWKISENEVKAAQDLESRFLDKMYSHGLLQEKPLIRDITSFSDASHHIGTTRMSAKAIDGVVDLNCKVWGTKNLYISGSSVFSTGGSANPTFTIAALALRLANHLKAEFKLDA